MKKIHKVLLLAILTLMVFMHLQEPTIIKGVSGQDKSALSPSVALTALVSYTKWRDLAGQGILNTPCEADGTEFNVKLAMVPSSVPTKGGIAVTPFVAGIDGVVILYATGGILPAPDTGMV